MGFLSGLGGLVSPGLTAATNTVGAYEGAQANAAKGQREQAIQQMLLLRQQHQQEIESALKIAQTGNYNSEAAARVNPKPKRTAAQFIGPDGTPVQGTMDESGTYYDGDGVEQHGALKPYVKPEGSLNDRTPRTFTVNGKPTEGFSDKQGNFYDASGGKVSGTITPYVAPQHDAFSFPTITGPDGKQIVARANTHTGEIAPTDVAAKAGGGGQSGTAQAQQARMLAALSEARLADERMRKFEDGLLSKQTKISPLQQAGGQLMTNLSGSHSALGALGQAGAEAALNSSSPDYAQYLRDAMTIGRAEQMISPRGGNETMVRANSLLARAGTGAAESTINASRMARQALFGASGGVEQSLTPQQSAKVNAGLQKIRSGSTGNVDLSKPSLPERVQQLKAHGLSKDAARVQLQHEGYDLGGGE